MLCITPTCAELCQPLLAHMYECMSRAHQLLSNLYSVKAAVVAIGTDLYLPQQRLGHHLQLKIMNRKRSLSRRLGFFGSHLDIL